jgi:putative membrane protein
MEPEDGRESQPERTRLAWRRTGLALVATTLLTIATVVRRGATTGTVALLGAILVIALSGLGLAQRRISRLSVAGFGRVGRTPAVLALLVTALGVLSAVIVVMLAASASA